MKFRPTQKQKPKDLKAVLHAGLLYTEHKGQLYYINCDGVQKCSTFKKNLAELLKINGTTTAFYEGDTLEVTF